MIEENIKPWSRKYKGCKVCNTSKISHRQEGFCLLCWGKERYRREKEKYKEYNKKYWEKNKEKLKKKNKDYYLRKKYENS